MAHNFSELINATSDARQRLKLLAVSHFIEGKNRTEIASFLKVSRRSVNIWIKAYLDFGLDGLKVKPRSGRPARLTSEQLAQVKSYVVENAIKPQGGRLQGKDVQEYIKDTFSVTYEKTNIYQLLHKLNLSWITTRSKHPKQSVEAQEAFKKIQNRNDP
jgi:transposase